MGLQRVAVTGGSGRLGRYVVAELAGRYEVTVLDIAPPADHPVFAEADILDLDGLRRTLAGHDGVVHLAAIDSGVKATDEQYFGTNVLGTWHVLQAAEEVGVRRAVVCSSVSAVGLGPDHPPGVLPIGANHALAPTDAYGLSKQACEVVAFGFARRGGLEVVCLRPALVVRPATVRDKAVMVAKLDGGGPPPPADDPIWNVSDHSLPRTRAFVGSEDAARCFGAALEADGVNSGPYFVTAADTMSPMGTLDVVKREFGVEPQVQRPEIYDDDPRASVFDIDATRQALGWEPKHRWADLMAQVADAADR